jgi:hypothetical protein
MSYDLLQTTTKKLISIMVDSDEEVMIRTILTNIYRPTECILKIDIHPTTNMN